MCAFIETYTMPIRWEYWLTYRFSSGDSLISLKHRASGEILFGLDDGIDGRDGMELWRFINLIERCAPARCVIFSSPNSFVFPRMGRWREREKERSCFLPRIRLWDWRREVGTIYEGTRRKNNIENRAKKKKRNIPLRNLTILQILWKIIIFLFFIYPYFWFIIS